MFAFSPPIEAGLSKRDFLKQLIEKTEKACDELLLLAAQDLNPPPLPPCAVKKLQKLNQYIGL